MRCATAQVPDTYHSSAPGAAARQSPRQHGAAHVMLVKALERHVPLVNGRTLPVKGITLLRKIVPLRRTTLPYPAVFELKKQMGRVCRQLLQARLLMILVRAVCILNSCWPIIPVHILTCSVLTTGYRRVLVGRLTFTSMGM